jgi:hypothetical protein
MPNAGEEDASVTLVPHPVYDATQYSNLKQLSTVAQRDGYSGTCATTIGLMCGQHTARSFCCIAYLDLSRAV